MSDPTKDPSLYRSGFRDGWDEGFTDCLAFLANDNPDLERASKHYARVIAQAEKQREREAR